MKRILFLIIFIVCAYYFISSRNIETISVIRPISPIQSHNAEKKNETDKSQSLQLSIQKQEEVAIEKQDESVYVDVIAEDLDISTKEYERGLRELTLDSDYETINQNDQESMRDNLDILYKHITEKPYLVLDFESMHLGLAQAYLLDSEKDIRTMRRIIDRFHGDMGVCHEYYTYRVKNGDDNLDIIKMQEIMRNCLEKNGKGDSSAFPDYISNFVKTYGIEKGREEYEIFKDTIEDFDFDFYFQKIINKNKDL